MITSIEDIASMQHLALKQRAAGKRVALVPTMGALHDGHLTLIRQARAVADMVVTSVFVNPTQFGQGEDFDRYPRDLEGDRAKAEAAGCDIVFTPRAADMYPEGYHTFVDVVGISSVLEGAVRPGHFRGVATVVLKLLQICQPHVAVFGQKDAQQVVIIRRMMQDLHVPTELMIIPTVREADGLAMSSRNRYLTPDQRREAPVLSRSLTLAVTQLGKGSGSCADVIEAMRAMITAGSGGVVDYISIADGETLEELAAPVRGRPMLVSLAVRFGATRLIDNVIIRLDH